MGLTPIAKSTTSSTSNTNTAISLTVPTGAAVNDLLLAVINLGSTTLTPTVPTGWAAVPGLTLPVTVSGLRLYVYYKLYAGEAGPYAFDSSGGTQMGAALYCYRGNATGTIFGAVGQNADATSDTSAVGPTLTTTVANSWVLSIASIPSNSTTFTALPASYVDRGGIGGKRVQLGDLAYPTAGTSTGALSWTSSAAALSAQVGIELLPLVAGTTYTLTLTGSLTSAGGLLKTTNRNLGGTFSPAGTVLKQTSRTVIGSLSSAGGLAKMLARQLSGSMAPGGTIAKQTSKALGGTLATAGSVTKRTARLLSGTLAPGGTVAKLTRRTLTGVLPSAGSVVGTILTLAATPATRIVTVLAEARQIPVALQSRIVRLLEELRRFSA